MIGIGRAGMSGVSLPTSQKFALPRPLPPHGCSNHSNLEMEAECLTKTLSCLNLNISRTKNGRNKL